MERSDEQGCEIRRMGRLAVQGLLGRLFLYRQAPFEVRWDGNGLQGSPASRD
ncbi:hypothetical protein ABZS68_30500 [Streptomyces sp. NPDC005571]|uniref:hypothetical protein n=1 Tax=Streptomyces sp. NPDC005571 TaxID=3156888 RepID=UPI0033A7EC6B